MTGKSRKIIYDMMVKSVSIVNKITLKQYKLFSYYMLHVFFQMNISFYYG